MDRAPSCRVTASERHRPILVGAPTGGCPHGAVTPLNSKTATRASSDLGATDGRQAGSPRARWMGLGSLRARGQHYQGWATALSPVRSRQRNVLVAAARMRHCARRNIAREAAGSLTRAAQGRRVCTSENHAGEAPHPRGVQVAATNPNRHCPSVLGRVKGSRSRKLARRRNAALDTACAR